MSRILTVVLFVGTLALVLSYQNCGKPADRMGGTPLASGQTVSLSGTVQKVNIDGCNYLICSNDNQTGGQQCFIPFRIDSSLLNDGNVVNVNGVIRGDIMTTCMGGPVIEVQNAALVSGSPAPSPTPFQ